MVTPSGYSRRQSLNIPAQEDFLESEGSGDDDNYSPSQEDAQGDDDDDDDGSDGGSDEDSDVEAGVGSKRKLPTKSGKFKPITKLGRADVQATRAVPNAQRNVTAPVSKGGKKKKAE